MKRFLIGAVAAAALAIPVAGASAEVSTTAIAEPTTSIAAPCTTPVVYCVQQALNALTIQHPCYPGETYADCAERIARSLDPYTIVFDVAIPLAFDTIGDGLTLAEETLQDVREACERISSSCDSALL